jgi:plastocyanin
VGAVAAAGVLPAACGSDDAAPETTDTTGRANTVAVVGTDRLRFDPTEFIIAAGQPITLELTAGSVEHDFVVEGAGRYGTAEAGHEADNPDDLHVAHADEDETVAETFMIDRAGTYTVYCSVPGHRCAGMVAILEVTDAQG